MFRVSGNQITMTAGDTGIMAIVPKAGSYIPTPEDRAIFTVREQPGRRALIEKIIVPEESGEVIVPLDSAETAKWRPREYAWDVRYALGVTTDAEGNMTDWQEAVTPMEIGLLTILPAIGGL